MQEGNICRRTASVSSGFKGAEHLSGTVCKMTRLEKIAPVHGKQYKTQTRGKNLPSIVLGVRCFDKSIRGAGEGAEKKGSYLGRDIGGQMLDFSCLPV